MKRTEDEKCIQMWRNERRNHCRFPTQKSYDEQSKKIKQLREQYETGEISPAMAISALVTWFHYGEVGARRVIDVWEREKENG